jgi:very-short-patch-repair endonuclease
LPGQRIRYTSPEIDQLARQLRRNSTPAEKLLWARLRNHQLNSLKFRRQHPLGQFIADFCCPACRVIVEVDGLIHQLHSEHDADRTQHFEKFGYQVLRFTNAQVEQDIDAVLTAIAAVCATRSH